MVLGRFLKQRRDKQGEWAEEACMEGLAAPYAGPDVPTVIHDFDKRKECDGEQHEHTDQEEEVRIHAGVRVGCNLT